jgi:hypothetical protein
MAKGPEGILISKILARHGARPDLCLWRNETALTWVGKFLGRTKAGAVILAAATRLMAGLCKHSADLVGLKGPCGQFIAIEVKTKNTPDDPDQERWLDLIRSLGGIAGTVRSVKDVDDLLGEPPEKE